MKSADAVQQPLGQDPDWSEYIINVAGNHDIGYAGDINQERMSRFVDYYGQPNYEMRFQRSNTSQAVFIPFSARRDEPEIRMIVLNSMNLDTPALDEQLQRESYDFINHKIIEQSRPVEDRTSFNIILTHIPLFKPDGVCVDGPLFTYHEDGIKEQNHLSEDVSRSFLEGILGMSPNVEAPAAGPDARGRAERGPGQEAAVVRLDAHGLARIATALGDGRVEHPRMAPLQRTLLAGTQSDRFHGVDCRHRAQCGEKTTTWGRS